MPSLLSFIQSDYLMLEVTNWGVFPTRSVDSLTAGTSTGFPVGKWTRWLTTVYADLHPPQHLQTALYIYVASLSVTPRLELEVLWRLLYKNFAEGCHRLEQEEAKARSRAVIWNEEGEGFDVRVCWGKSDVNKLSQWPTY